MECCCILIFLFPISRLLNLNILNTKNYTTLDAQVIDKGKEISGGQKQPRLNAFKQFSYSISKDSSSKLARAFVLKLRLKRSS